MIKKTIGIDNFISKENYIGMQFHTLRVKFSSRFESNVRKLEEVLEIDKIPITIKRVFLLRWELVMEIPIISEFNEEEYHKLLGKFFLLASRCVVNIRTIVLLD